jgi:hypothetical protein
VRRLNFSGISVRNPATPDAAVGSRLPIGRSLCGAI